VKEHLREYVSANGKIGLWTVFDDCPDKVASNDSRKPCADVEEVFVAKLLVERSYYEIVRRILK
jgi:hypothetical protein